MLLRELDAAVQAAQWQAPVLPEHRLLLEAIPVNVLPVMQAPSPEAAVAPLCAGIISIAQRANQARRELAARAAWSPELTADSMRHAAANSVVTSLNTETVYRVLAVRAGELGYHALVPGLEAAAGRAGDSRRAWLAVAHVWDTMVTDTRGYLSRPAAEAGPSGAVDRPAGLRRPRHGPRPAGHHPPSAPQPAWHPARPRSPRSLAPCTTPPTAWSGRPTPSLTPSAQLPPPGACTSPPAACPNCNMTCPGRTPMRLATGSPPRWPPTRTPPTLARRCCTRPLKPPPRSRRPAGC